jgi:hypothetical protein
MRKLLESTLIYLQQSMYERNMTGMRKREEIHIKKLNLKLFWLMIGSSTNHMVL